jgi:hypothetical protein
MIIHPSPLNITTDRELEALRNVSDTIKWTSWLPQFRPIRQTPVLSHSSSCYPLSFLNPTAHIGQSHYSLVPRQHLRRQSYIFVWEHTRKHYKMFLTKETPEANNPLQPRWQHTHTSPVAGEHHFSKRPTRIITTAQLFHIRFSPITTILKVTPEYRREHRFTSEVIKVFASESANVKSKILKIKFSAV